MTEVTLPFLKWLFDLTPNRCFFLSLPFPNVVFQLSLIVGMDAASLEENHPWTRCCCPFSFVFYLSPLPILTQKVFFNLFFFFLYEKILVYSIHILLHTVKMQVMISYLCPFGTSDIVSFKYLRKNVCNWAGIINTTLYIYKERDNYTLLTCDLLLIWFACSWF